MKKLLYLWYLVLGAIAAGQTKISELPPLAGSAASTADALPIVVVSAGAEGSRKITLAELFSTPVPWQGPVIAGQYGGTGVNNSGKTITLGGNLTTSGANPLTLTTTGATNVTLPTSGTLATVTEVVTKIDARSPVIDVTTAPYNAVGDGMRVDNCVVSGTSLTAAGVDFSSKAGKYIRIEGAGASGSDYIGIIASGTSGECSLNPAAPTPIASNGVAFFGTNNSSAFQLAIDTARAGLHTVFIPPGVYLTNCTNYRGVKILGCGSGQALEALPTSSQLADREILPTVLMPAVASLPVVAFDRVFGASLDRICISGSVRKVGIGVQFGPDTGSAYWGHACTSEDLYVCGFLQGITLRSVSTIFHGLMINDCTHGCWIGALAGGVNGGVKLTIKGMLTHHVDYVFNTHSSLATLGAISVEAADWNWPITVANIREDFSFVGRNVNWETNGGDVFNLYGARSSLDIWGCHHLNVAPNAMVANYGTTNKVSIGGCAASQGLVYKTAGQEYPHLLDSSMMIKRYSSSAWSVLNETEYGAVIYRNDRSRDRDYVINEEFFRSPGTSPYGELGWTCLKIGGVDPTIAAHSNPINGTIRLTSGADTGSSNAYRFSLPNVTGAYGWSGWPGVSNMYWEQTWTFSNAQAATTVMRLGMFSVGSSLIPSSGVGIRLDRSLGTPDASVKLIVISGGVEYPVDTGVSHTALNPTNSMVMATIRRVPGGGFSCILRDALTRVPLAPEVFNTQTLPADSWAPAAYIGSTGGSIVDVRADRMTWRQIFAN